MTSGEKAPPLVIRARIKDGPEDSYPTRTLSDLADFRRGDSVRLTRYGGWAAKRSDATGFFRTEKIGDRWWLIDPEGYRFYHVAVNVVRPGRGPQMLKAFAEKYADEAAWRDETLDLLHRHGFNGTGAASTDELLSTGEPRLAYAPLLSFMGRYGRSTGRVTRVPGHLKFPGDCMFVFEPEFAAFADEQARRLAALKDDPWVLGYFSDNELPFLANSLANFLALPTGDPGKTAADAWLAERKSGKRRKSDLTDDDREAFRVHLAETCFRICRDAIRKYDPNHLYLGARFYRDDKESPALLAAAGRHVDVVSINVYGVWTPTRDYIARWTEWSGKPVMITEWYAKGDDTGLANLTGAGWTVPTQTDRGHFYQNFVLGLIEAQNCVGWHWFAYQDNDPTDPSPEPSGVNSNKGIVDVAYRPHQALLDAMKEMNEATYPLTEYLDARPPQPPAAWEGIGDGTPVV